MKISVNSEEHLALHEMSNLLRLASLVSVSGVRYHAGAIFDSYDVEAYAIANLSRYHYFSVSGMNIYETFRAQGELGIQLKKEIHN